MPVTVPDAAPPAVYGLEPPDLALARTAVEHVCPGTADAVWSALLDRAGLSGGESGLAAVDRVVAAMTGDPDPVVVLGARALAIRLSAYRHLAVAHDLMTEDHR